MRRPGSDLLEKMLTVALWAGAAGVVVGSALLISGVIAPQWPSRFSSRAHEVAEPTGLSAPGVSGPARGSAF